MRDTAIVRREALSNELIKGLEPEPREFTLWDAKVPSLGVRVLPSGSRVYILRFRQDRRQRWRTLGRHGEPAPPEPRTKRPRVWDVATARSFALVLLGRKEAGEDITRVALDALAELPDLKRLAELFLAEHVDVYLKASSAERVRTSLDRHILPRLGKVRVDRLKRDDCAAMHAAMKVTPVAANRALVTLHGLLKFAQVKGYRPDNPAKGVRYYREKTRERYLSADETTRLARALAEAEGRESPFVLAAFKLILLTGCRQGEVFGLRWSEVDLERGVLTLEDAKTGGRVVYLNELAQDVLAELPRVSGNPYVIPGWKKGTHYQGEQKAWERIREAAGVPDLRLHDLRHNFASVLASGGASLQMIGQLLGHRRIATTQRYSHLVDSALRELTEKAAAALQSVAAPPPRGKVLPHRRARR